MSDERTPIEDMKEAFEDLREHDGERVKIYMPKDAYDRLSPEMIADREAAYHCEIVPVSATRSTTRQPIVPACQAPRVAVRPANRQSSQHLRR